LALAVASVAGCAQRHAVFRQDMATLRRVAILPPDVHLVRYVFKGDNETLTTAADAASLALPSFIAPHLASHGFVVRPARLDEEQVGADTDLRYLATTVRARHGAFVGNALTGNDARWFGTDVGRLADNADVDALLFVRLDGFTKSSGQVARDVAVSVLSLGSLVYRTNATRLFVTLVNGTTGEVLWWRWHLTEERAFEGAALGELVGQVFDKMPNLPPAAEPTTSASAPSGPR
jgi:hypothetical protein